MTEEDVPVVAKVLFSGHDPPHTQLHINKQAHSHTKPNIPEPINQTQTVSSQTDALKTGLDVAVSTEITAHSLGVTMLSRDAETSTQKTTQVSRFTEIEPEFVFKQCFGITTDEQSADAVKPQPLFTEEEIDEIINTPHA